MNKVEMISKLKKVFANVLNLPEQQISNSTTMDNCPTWDSLTHMDLIVAVESEFLIALSGDEISEMLSFKAIETLLLGKIGLEN